MKKFKYSLTFATKLKPLISEEIDKHLALASKTNLKDFLPKNIDFDKKIDFLAFSGEFCTVNRINANDDAIQTKEALEIVKLLPFSFIDAEHDRKAIVGVITSAHFNEFGSNKILSEDDVKDKTEPFNISVAGLIWRLVNPELAEYVESSGDPDSENYGKVFLSWELLFDKANLVEIDATKKNLKDGKIISDPSIIETLEDKLKANGGKGYTENGKRLARIPIDEIIPAGCALTENPAGEDLKPISILSAGIKVIEVDNTEAKLECQASTEHFIEKCSCGKVIGQCRCSSPNKKVIIKENGCKECKEKTSAADFTGFSNISTKESYSNKDSEKLVQQNITPKVEPVVNEDLLPKTIDYKFGKCPSCNNVSDYNSFIKTWNSSQGVITCGSCNKTSLSASWEFNNENIWNKTAENLATDKKEQIVANKENKMSHLESVNVNKDNKTMKISSLKDITDENLKECKASEVQDFISSELKKISDDYVKEKNEKEGLVEAHKKQVEETKASLEKANKELADVKASLDTLLKEKEAQAKLATFSARMATIDDKFELNDKEKEILGSKIKNLDKDEEFTKFLEETEILLAAKKKATKKDKDPDKDGDDDTTKEGDTDKDFAGKDKKESKASKEDTTKENIVDEALKTGKENKVVIANTTTAAAPTLSDRMKTAFGLENWSVVDKKKNRV